MRVTDTVTGQRFNPDEAYQRFFDGFYNLGKPSEIFQGTMVLSSPQGKRVKTRRRTGSPGGSPPGEPHGDSAGRKLARDHERE